MKYCPHCSGEIQDEAVKCKHCRETLGEASFKRVEEPCNNTNAVCRPFKLSWTLVPAVVAVFVLAAIISSVCSSLPNREQNRPQSNLQTSLWGGPDPKTLSYFLEKNFLWRYSKENLTEKISELKLSNEYKRNIAGETIYFFEFTGYDTWFSKSSPPEIVYCLSLVKRGKSWYLYKNMQ